MTRRTLFIAVCVALASSMTRAHEMRPAYLNLLETSPGEYAVLWKTPMRGDARLALDVEFSGEVAPTSDEVTEVRSSAAIQQWTVLAPELRGQTVRVRGLESTMTDVLVKIDFADGTSWRHLLTPRAPAAAIGTAEPEPSSVPDQGRGSLVTAVAAWAVMCCAAVFARQRERKPQVKVAYLTGMVAAFFLIRSIVEVVFVA